MNEVPEGTDAAARDRDEAPSPRRTVVGGRPPEGRDARHERPEGIELLLTAAARDEPFRRCFLEDRLLAARRAGITLAASERSILTAVPRAQLEAMIASMALSDPARRRFLHSAATAALIVFAGTALAACGESTDESEPEPKVPLTGVAAALAEAKKTRRPLMVVLRSEYEVIRRIAGIGYDIDETRRLRYADELCRWPSEGVLQIADREGFLVYEHAVTLEQTDEGERWTDEFARKLAVKDLPTVLFLDPDGEELTRLVQPAVEMALMKGIVAAGALAKARREGQVLMVSIRLGGGDRLHAIAGVLSEETRRRWDSDILLDQPRLEVLDAAVRAGIQVFDYGSDSSGPTSLENHKDAFVRTYEVFDPPVAIFLAPDGSELLRLLHPVTEEELLAGIEEAAAAFAERGESAEKDGDE